jgi:eukaryotic-like serine/threonine-protein kinase
MGIVYRGERYAAADRIGSGDTTTGVYDILIAGGSARVALMRDRLQRADSLLQFALGAAKSVLRPDHRYVHELKRTLGAVRIAQGRSGEVPALLEPVLEQHDSNLPNRHPLRAATLLLLAEARLAMGEPARAESTVRTAMLNLTALPPSHWMQGESKSLLGAALVAQGRTDDGRALLQEGLRIITAHVGTDSWAAERARNRITSG